MGIKSITDWEAREIAKKISEKAFEHLVTPHETRLDNIGQRAYKCLLDELGTTSEKLIAAGFSSGNEEKISIGGGEKHRLVVKAKGERIVTLYYGELKLENDDLFDELTVVYEALNPLVQKRNELTGVLTAQMMGRSASAAKKAWPEAEQFINDQFSLVTAAEGMTRPLEELLARFLPALAAPQGA